MESRSMNFPIFGRSREEHRKRDIERAISRVIADRILAARRASASGKKKSRAEISVRNIVTQKPIEKNPVSGGRNARSCVRARARGRAECIVRLTRG